MFWIHIVVYSVFTLLLAILVRIYMTNGTQELLRVIVLGFKCLPGVEDLIGHVLHKEAKNFLQDNVGRSKSTNEKALLCIPEKGTPREDLMKELETMKATEVNHEDGKIFAYIYTLDNDVFKVQRDVMDKFRDKTGLSEEHDDIINEFHHAFLHENALNPMIFPSLRRMETEVVSMTSSMMHGDSNTVGFITSGGTESVLMAIKTFRDRARKLFPRIQHPEIVCPITQHPALDKAAHYFGLKVIHTPVGKDQRANVHLMEKAITPNTILLAASAPQYCHGIVDPIEDISNLAIRKGLPLFIDACFGGFMLPWVEKLGHSVPLWDFRLPGVTAISADVHKYGYGIKGASVIVYKNSDIRKFQIFSYADWPGGLFGSPSMAGTRPGGNIAAAWAAMRSMGQQGYMIEAKKLMAIRQKLMDGINSIEGIAVIGQPHMTAFAIVSQELDLDIMAVSDVMESRDWKIERGQNPNCIHCSLLPHHYHVADTLLEDLKFSVGEVKKNKDLAKKGTAAVYGMVATIPDKAIVTDFITEVFSELYKT